MARPSPSVLLIDDSLGVSTALCMMLQEEGFAVEAVHTYATALEVATRIAFDLLIIDVHLGPDSGLRLAEEILRRRLPCKMILISGLFDLTTEFDQYSEAKNLPVLMKPFGRRGLLDCVHRTLNEAAA